MLICSALLLALPARPLQDPPVEHEVCFSVSAPDERGPLFLAGTFNRWQPGDEQWKLTREGEGDERRWRLTVPLGRLGNEEIEFKLTRGSWDAVEVLADLTDRPNRVLRKPAGSVKVELIVEAWIDDRPGFVPAAVRESTVTGHLDIFDVPSERLKNIRKVRVWLPPGYDAEENAERVYPVLYLHDGQNVFDAATSYQGTEWGADESATRLIDAGSIPPLILVGVDHAGAARTAEYNPPFTSKGGVAHSGDRYLDFLTQTVMPEVEKRYRIARGPENTGLGGSSYGGNITLYAGMRHPDRFGLLLVESPIFWVFNSTLMRSCARHEPWTQRIHVAVGAKESTDERVQAGYQRGIDELRAVFEAQGLIPGRARLVVEPEGTHHETAWARRFPGALEFLFAR